MPPPVVHRSIARAQARAPLYPPARRAVRVDPIGGPASFASGLMFGMFGLPGMLEGPVTRRRALPPPVRRRPPEWGNRPL
jgi:hypothetical protein